jgi:hypothetical protein
MEVSSWLCPGLYDEWMYHAILAFDCRGFNIGAVLRPDSASDSVGVLGVVSHVVARIMEELPKAKVIARTGGGSVALRGTPSLLSADRHSCHRFLANQFRLLSHLAAFFQMFLLRERLAWTTLGDKQLDALRLRIPKLGARVCTSSRTGGIRFHLASGWAE